MKHLSHLIWTFTISLWIYYFIINFNLYNTLLFSFLTSLFAPLPDIDIKIVKYFKKLNFKTFFLTFPIYIIIKLIFKHRTITHSILFALIFYLFYYYFKINQFNFYFIYFIFSIFLAVILHILEDSLTKSGIVPFYPIKLKIRFWSFSTNSNIDEFIINTIGIFIGILFIIFFII